MRHEPRPTRVMKHMERKATETYTFTKSDSHEEKCLAEKKYQRGRMSDDYFPSPLKMIPVREGLATTLLY